MAIITVWNGTKEQCGNTLTSVALATQTAIDHNIKVLLISTSLNDRVLKECFWKEKAKKQNPAMLGGIMMPPMGIEKSGVEGLDRIIRSNKMSPDIITDYTRIVLKDRLEVLLGMEGNAAEYDTMKQRYSQIINFANKYYDMVIVDLDKRLGINQQEILKKSDVVVAVIPQRVSEINTITEYLKKGNMLKPDNTVITIGKYMEDTKYNIKNITRSILKRKEMVNAIPYNKLFFEASQEGKVIDLFLNLMRITEKDANYDFVTKIKDLIQEVKDRLDILKRLS